MGTWGTRTFDNDTACDWAYGLEDAHDLSLVEETIRSFLTAGQSFDPDLACEALAACEVVARLRGGGGHQDSYTEVVDKWVAEHQHLQSTPRLLADANKVISHVLSEDSELAKLWAESGSDVPWRMAVEELRGRLR